MNCPYWIGAPMDIGVDRPRSEDIGEPRNVEADLCVGPNPSTSSGQVRVDTEVNPYKSEAD